MKAPFRGENLLCDGYLYKKNRKRENIQYYKCVIDSCPSRLTLEISNNKIINKPATHPHLPPEDRVSEQKFKEKIIEKIEKNPVVPLKTIYENQVQETDENYLPPAYSQVRKSMSRTRGKKLPPIPKSFEEINLNDQWTKTSNNKDFLLHQGDDMLNFATIQGLEFLVRSKNILGDGTFKTAPRPFLQIYTIFGSSEKWKVPVVWAFLMRKSEETYQKFFEILTQKCQFFCNWPLMLEIFLTDFETGILPAIKKVFYVTSHLGCWFHYTQCIFRKFQELGFSREYKNDPTLHMIACRLFSLPFLPVDELMFVSKVISPKYRKFFLDTKILKKFFSTLLNFG